MKSTKPYHRILALAAGAVLLTALSLQDPGRFLTSRTGRLLELPSEAPAFQFAVFADRTGGPAEGIRVLKEAVDETNLIGPDLVLTVGDLINGYNTTPEWMAQMIEFRATMNELDCPWFPVAGNHDVYWRGPAKPPQEHEDHYEEHFGPLWYAFEHKGAWFIILYTDEPDPETGERNYTKRNSQRMSPVQFEWLRETLVATGEADHVFVFLHHPRWNGGSYGNDWDRVHELLASAGNVRAVFAGHIHRMQYAGPRDGIEYFTLATTGGNQNGTVPEAGFLHHYELVTVREAGIDVVSFPVGSAEDPRAITREVSDETAWLADHLRPEISGDLAPDGEGSVRGAVSVKIRNPVKRPVEFTLTPLSDDFFWSFSDHWHGVLEPGAEQSVEIIASRPRAGLNAGFRFPEVEVAADTGAVDNVIGEGDVPSSVRTVPNTTGRHFTGAGGDRIRQIGTCKTLMRDSNGREIGCQWRVADVTRALHSISRIAGPEDGDGDHDVLFNNKRGVVVPPGTVDKVLLALAKQKIKPITEYKRKGGLYVAKMKLSGFARPGQGQ